MNKYAQKVENQFTAGAQEDMVTEVVIGVVRRASYIG